MSDFDIKNSLWWNLSGIERASTWVRNDAESLAQNAKNLLVHPYSEDAESHIADAETALSEALLAVKLAKSAYQKKQPVMAEAAE